MTMNMIITLLVVAFGILVLLALYIKGYKKLVLRIIRGAVEKAEIVFNKDGAGEARLNYVIGKVYQRIPLWITLFIKESDIINWINDAVEYMNKKLLEAEQAATDEHSTI